MSRKRRKVSLGLSTDEYDEGCHIIYLYNNDHERKHTMARYLRQGLANDEKVLYLVHDISPQEMREELGKLGVDTETAQKAFDMMVAHYKQCPGEVFSKDYMLAAVKEYYKSAIADGYAGARGAGEMSWAAESGCADFTELINYECALNQILEDYPLTTVCQYDVRLFSGQIIMDMLSVHPVAIVRGQVVRNPYYIPPDKFLDDLQHRAPTA